MDKLLLANDCLVERMRKFSEATGTPMEQCIHDALDLWLSIEAETILEELAKPSRTKGKLRLIK